MSWADLPLGQYSPHGGEPGSWWGLEQLAAEVDSAHSESQGAFPASILFLKTPREGQDSFHISILLVLGKSFLTSDSCPSGTQVSMEFSEKRGAVEVW